VLAGRVPVVKGPASALAKKMYRARCGTAPPASGLHVVLVEPEIPPNTGSIARLCAATSTRLHLVEPLGFSLEDRYLKRAGLDYWPHVDLVLHEHWPAFMAAEQPAACLLFSARAEQSYLTPAYAAACQVYLVFGGETRGLPSEIIAAHKSWAYRIPILSPHVRSLNLANAVSIVVYEALRQRGAMEGCG
jgi:tRNA (cytidine/uridine-2'-O-)-methyltransferase